VTFDTNALGSRARLNPRPTLTQFVISKSKTDSQPLLYAARQSNPGLRPNSYALKTMWLRESDSRGLEPGVLADKVRSNSQRVDKTKFENGEGEKRNAETEGLFTD
jgi:hypothetical protein